MREQRRRRQNREEDFNDRGRSAVQRLDSIQDPGKRYLLRDCIGSGVCGDVYEAIDRQAGIVIALCSIYFLFSIYIYNVSKKNTYLFFFIPSIRSSRMSLTENKRVAVKVQKLTPESESMILEEYRILRDYTSHPNLPDFYGIYRRRSGKKTEYDQIWFVMEVRNRRMENRRNGANLSQQP